MSASVKQTMGAVAIAAPPFLAAPIMRLETVATRQPRAAAIAAVASVELLSATMTSMASGPCANRARAASTVSSSRGSSCASLNAGMTSESLTGNC